jgi:hypothetical protein
MDRLLASFDAVAAPSPIAVKRSNSIAVFIAAVRRNAPSISKILSGFGLAVSIRFSFQRKYLEQSS